MSVTFFWPTVIQSRLASIAKERKNKLKKKKAQVAYVWPM